MLPSDTWQAIHHDRVRQLVQEYPDVVPAKLGSLDEIRFKIVPGAVKERAAAGKAFLEKEELLSLVEWKLKHGTFRPNLMKLVSSNDAAAIKTVTTEAFTATSGDDISKGMSILTSLSGIGPATASLVLSVHNPGSVPFFSDELFRYVHVDTDASSEIRGWDRKIGYTKKEFDMIYKRVGEIRKRLNTGYDDEDPVTALDLEKIAYVLARSKVATPAAPSSKRKQSHESPLNASENDAANGLKDTGERYPKRNRSQIGK